MAVRTITTRLALDGEAQFKQAMTGVNASLRAMKSELTLSEAQFKGQANSVEALTAKDKLLRQEIEQQTQKVRALEQALRDAAQVYGEDSNQVSNYQAQLNRAKTELVGMNQALETNSRYLDEAKNSVSGTASSIDGFGNATKGASDGVSALAGALQAAGVAYTVKEIAAALRECADASMEFETAMADVNKVAKLSDQELAGMGDAIKELSTEMPATTTEIANVVEAAARLGVAKDDLIDFARVMLDLGNVSDLSSEQAATALARFANITGTASEDYERLGSTVVALGNNFATSESEITEMSSRLAAAGELAGLSEADIMGLSAAMASVGINAEAGGTAMTQALTAIEKAVTSGGDKLDQFAQVAGMSSREFSDAWSSDPITAIQAFISGLAGLDEKGESATQVLEELGLSGIRQSNMLKSLALANETLVSAVDTANRAWEENTELAATAAAKYDTTEAKVAILNNQLNNLKITVGDQLTPALGLLAQAGTAAFGWVSDVLKDNPGLVAAFSGIVGALGAIAVAAVAMSVKVALSTAAVKAFSAALIATPLGPVALAVGVLTAGFVSVAGEMDNTAAANQRLTDSLEESKRAYQDTVSAQKENQQATEDLLQTVANLAEKENKTAAEKETLLQLVNELSDKVPGLALQYDSLNDSLSLTAEQIREIARAEAEREAQATSVDRLKQVYVEQIQIQQELEQAYQNLTDAQKEYDDALREGWDADAGMIESLEALKSKLGTAQKAVEDLEAAQVENEAEIRSLEAQYGELEESLDSVSAATQSTVQAVEEAADAQQAAAASAQELEDATLYLAGAQDTLTKALKEQSEAGSLSYKTVQSLIEAGYASALAIDNETGAVTLNKDAYINLTNAKIQDQIAALQVQKAAVLSADKLYQEATAARHAGSAYWELAKDKAVAAHADDTKALDAQIAALKRAQSALSSYSYTTQSAARQSSSASKQIKTQAEQDLASYKELKAELDHRKNMDLVDEAEYYKRLGELRDSYLTDEANISEYRKITEAIYKYDKALAEKEAELWAEQSETVLDAAEERVDQAKQDLDAYKRLKDELDHLKTMDQVQEGEYYRRLAELRDNYLTDESNLSEYRRVTEAIYRYDKSLAEKESDLWTEQSEALVSSLEERVKAVSDQQSSMMGKLSNYGDLFYMQDYYGRDYMNLGDLQKQIDAINEYEKALTQLRERGISEGLMDQVLGMDLDDATQYANRLLGLGQEQWDKYNDLWEEKQIRAAQVAEEFFKEQIDSLEQEYSDKLEGALEPLQDAAFSSGVNTGQGLIDGLASQETALYAKAQAIRDEIDRILSTARVPSNAELASSFSTSRISEAGNTVTGRDVRQATANIVNGLSTAMEGQWASDRPVEGDVYLDSQKVGKIMLPGLRREANANPEVKNDR